MSPFFKQFTTYAVVGVTGTAVHFAVLFTSVQFLSLSPLFGSAAGFICGAVTNYFLNYHITFSSRSKYSETSLRFFSIALLGLALNTVIIYATLPWVHYLLSQALASVTVLITTFLLNRYWTFKGACFVK